MNVVVFVMTMLMLMALMTYARLEQYRSFNFMQAQFKKYMETTQRDYANSEARKRYRNTVATKKDETINQQAEQAPGSAKFPFHLFVDKDLRRQNGELFTQQMGIMVNLMQTLYKDQKFYTKLVEKRPSFIQEIVDNLVKVSEGFDPNKKMKQAKELATVDLEDLDLNDAFAKVLAGYKEPDPLTEKPLSLAQKRENAAKTNFLVEGEITPLLDLITLDKSFSPKIRVYTAPPQLLLGLFGSPAVVYQILTTRIQLYNEVIKKNGLPAEEATELFKESFVNLRLPIVPEEMLDFTVSKTNPTKYEVTAY